MLFRSITGTVALTGRGEIVNDAEADPRSLTVPGTPPEQSSLLCAPLISRDHVLGVITLSLVNGVLTMNTGEFETRMVMQKGTNTESSAVLVAADPPIPGTPFALSVDDFGLRTLRLEFGTDTYSFRQIDVDATPTTSTPAGS